MTEATADLAAGTPRAGGTGLFFRDSRVLGLVSVVIGLGLWELAADSFSDLILPPPSAVLARFLDPVFLPRLLTALGYSLGALGLGFALALAIAIPLGLVLGRSRTLLRMFEPLINAIYAIPPVAFVPFLIIWFGLFFEGRVALVFMMCFFDILVIIIAGSRDVRKSLVDVGRSFGASRSQALRMIVLPALTPFLFAALRVGSARAINGMITAELFFAAANLGQIMKRSTQAFDTASALAVVVTICLLGLLAQTVIQLLERRLLSWHVRS
jgi:ABC-type nitrate/sulfonate/bicarbonate transport system permease component